MIDFEEEAEATKRMHADHASLAEELERLTKDEVMLRVPVTVKRLVDNGIEPIIVAKVMLIGRRPGSVMYELACASHAISASEAIAEQLLAMAIKPLNAETAIVQLSVGASWLAQQYKVDVDTLLTMVLLATAGTEGSSAIDLTRFTAGRKQLIIDSLKFAKQPDFAPLELRNPTGSDSLQS